VVMVPSPVPPDGGGFVLSETRDAEGSVGYEHTGGAAVLMPLGDASFHAVGRVHRGIRLSLILSFWAQTQTDLDVPSPATSDSPGTSPATLPAIRMLTELGASKAHSGASLLAHLFGTHEILRRW